MAEIGGFAQAFAGALAEVAPVLDERARRLLMGAAARQLGRGGITLIAAATGASKDTVGRGAGELEAGVVVDGRIRATGAGRKLVEHHDPGLWPALDELVDPETRGDPMSRLRWTTKSTVKLADELAAQGHQAGPDTVARLLKDHDYSLQGNAKTIEGKQHPDRDAQFRYLNDQVTTFLTAGLPVISVDTKKKELVGAYKNGGKEYQPQGSPVPTNTHDFPGEAGKAVPYGVYDVGANSGWVNVGVDADTGMFAVESIRRWWGTIGSPAYPDADRLLITADSGGSNGSRLRLWKTQLAELATETGLRITVCHLPPGTSKWNKIEHPDVLRDHPELARPAPGNPRGRRRDHRGDHHQDRTEHPSRPRHQHLPERHQDHRQGDESLRGRPPATTQVPRQLELHRDGHACRQHDTPASAGVIDL